MWTPPASREPRPIPEWLAEGGPGLPAEWLEALWAMTIQDPAHAQAEDSPLGLEFMPEPKLLGRGVRRETLRELFEAGLADLVESTPDGDPVGGLVCRRGPFWLPTPLGARLARVRLEEYEDDRPVWVMAGVEESPGVRVQRQLKARGLTDRILHAAELARVRRAEERERAEEDARERLARERAGQFWGRRRYAGKGRRRKARRKRPIA